MKRIEMEVIEAVASALKALFDPSQTVIDIQ
jgi:hypothetical protein